MSRYDNPKVSSINVRSPVIDHFIDSNYHFILRQHFEAISELQGRWLSVLSSPTRYANLAEAANQLADTITGASHPSLCWLSPVVIDGHTNHVNDEDDFLGINAVESPLDPEQAVLSDILEFGQYDSQDELEFELKAEALPRIMLNWQLPEV